MSAEVAQDPKDVAPDPKFETRLAADVARPRTLVVLATDWSGAGGLTKTRNVTMTCRGEVKRTAPQGTALEACRATMGEAGWPDGDALFGAADDLSWSSRQYTFALAGNGAEEQPRPCFLFNVIVALEWLPSPAYLRQLRRGFQRASELLYDVTNGQMAFGKVIFADDTWMDCADIQVLASNRILPRAWTGGLIVNDKYMPIRVGRGIRARDRREILMWDEADAYHTLIHEWLHYAVALRDGYLDAPTTYASAQGPGGAAGPFSARLVLPEGGLGDLSIMATPAGHSELSKQELLPEDKDLTQRVYKGLVLNARVGEGDPGPYVLPVPLPVFQLAGKLKTDRLRKVIATPEYLRLEQLHPATSDAELVLPQDSETGPFQSVEINDPAWYNRWEISVLRGKGQESQVIAQGILDATALNVDRTFKLFGAAEGDVVAIAGTRSEADFQAYECTVEGTAARLDPATAGHGPRLRPLVDVFPDLIPGNTDPRKDKVKLAERGPEGWGMALYPGGRHGADACALDGQVVLETATAEHGSARLVCNYSRGGVPVTISNTPPNPLSAGSADGGALIFGYIEPDANKDAAFEAYKKEISRTMVVTTSIPWLPDDEPKLSAGDTTAIRPLSNVFSITASRSLDFSAEAPGGVDTLDPTLVVFFEPGALRDGEVAILCRQTAEGRNTWEPMPTRHSGSLCAVPLKDRNNKLAPRLLDREVAAEQRFERFCLFALCPAVQQGVDRHHRYALQRPAQEDAG